MKGCIGLFAQVNRAAFSVTNHKTFSASDAMVRQRRGRFHAQLWRSSFEVAHSEGQLLWAKAARRV